jgi:hypothetical protein
VGGVAGQEVQVEGDLTRVDDGADELARGGVQAGGIVVVEPSLGPAMLSTSAMVV